jgi:hypothetical protein
MAERQQASSVARIKRMPTRFMTVSFGFIIRLTASASGHFDAAVTNAPVQSLPRTADTRCSGGHKDVRVEQ